ncbi:MAG: Molybdenum ABC transporter permease protein ModB [uncultured Thermomicrobiales bacterium]|uniref:Molybdenum transport system permease n=1 Tax=uncultured Thermomicrobiales bacterium TaxID=1645740 RepID=A0A6J4V134_9BACT|nr:MAG: Molybdenum ABC transporter permease protein ModB [uncultured Thermomicrobiales bacterium]
MPNRRAGTERLAPLVWSAAALLVVFLALPMTAMVWRAWGESRGLTPEALRVLRRAMGLSLATTGATMLVVALLGTPLAYALARRRFPGAALVDTLVDLPIVLPPAVAGIALLMAFGRRGVLGRWLDEAGIQVTFTTTAVVLAQVFVAVPFFVRAAKAGFARVDRDTEAAAADLGASPARVFWTVTLPLARPGLAAGAVLAWARALGEFGATIMFAGNNAERTQTMPLAIYGRYYANDLQSALLLAMVLLGAAVLVLLSVRLAGGNAGSAGL